MECTNLKNIILELQNAATQVDEEQVEKFADAIIAAKNIFVAGAGRSGFAARGFANRLLHLGFHVAFVGDPTTPPIKETGSRHCNRYNQSREYNRFYGKGLYQTSGNNKTFR